MKYPIAYAVRTTRAPGETEDTTVPVIIDRVQATDLARVVENCIDRGLIAGLKPTAAQGIAEGVAEQIAKEFTLGRSVAFGQYFYGRPYLGGTVDANGRVTSANGVNVRLYKGNAFKLTLDDFTFTFDGSGDSPRIDSVLSDGSGLRGEVVKGSSVKVNGRFLNAAGDANKVYFAEVGADDAEPVVVDAFTAAGDDILSFACPAALVAGRKYSVKAERIDPNGVTRTSTAKTVTVKAAEPTPPPEPIAETRDGLVKVMSVADDETGDTFTYGDTWRARGEGFVGTAPGWAVNMAFIQLEPDAEAIALDFDVRGAAEIKLDSKEEYPVAAGDYPGAKLMVEFCHPDAEDPDEQVSETLVMPIHIVSNE